MNDHSRVVALTQVAMQNAIILSFLSIQFVVSPAFALMLWIVPTIFALEACRVPLGTTVLSGLLLVTMSLVLFGVDIGLWTLLYVSAGGTLGIGQRGGWHWSIRFVATWAVLTALLMAIAATFAWMMQMDLLQVINIARTSHPLYLWGVFLVLALGLTGWMVIVAAVVDRFLHRVLGHMDGVNIGTV